MVTAYKSQCKSHVKSNCLHWFVNAEISNEMFACNRSVNIKLLPLPNHVFIFWSFCTGCIPIIHIYAQAMRGVYNIISNNFRWWGELAIRCIRHLIFTSKIWNHRYRNFIHVEWKWNWWIMYLFRYSHQTWCFWRYCFRLQKAFKMVFNSEKISYFTICVMFLKVLTYSFIKLVNWSGKRTRKWNVNVSC